MSIRTIKSLFSHIQEMRKVVLLFVVLLSIGTFFYSHVENWSLIDSLYFSVATVTTVGYGDFHPTQTITKIFTMLYILIGFGVVLYILTSIVTHLLEKKDAKIINLENKIIELEKQLKDS